jgi:hypothetical protein
VALLKDTFTRFSCRGGGKGKNMHWTKKVLERICIRMVLKAFGDSDWFKMMTPYERKKFMKDYIAKL